MKYFAALLSSAVLFVACSGESSSPISAPDSNGKISSSSVESGNVSSSSTTYSSGVSSESSSSSVVQGPGTSSGINSVEGSSSSRPTDILEPEITVNETCTEVGACDAMVKTDVSTWHFVRKDAFGDDAEYIYRADGRDLIVTIKNADGSIDSKTYSMYNMESEAGVEIAFNAAKATCKDGGGNDNKVKNCVKDTTFAQLERNPNINYGSMTDSRDKMVYETVQIGDQTWMAQNLNYYDETLDGRSWCFDNDSNNCAKYGRLYTWAAAIDSVKLYKDKSIDCSYDRTCSLPDSVSGICPPGWHLPTRSEWDSLIDEVGGTGNAGKVLKSQTGWNNDGNGTDSVGFGARPFGTRHYDGSFEYDDEHAYFWSASEHYDISLARYLYLESHSDMALVSFCSKGYGFPVRCIKNEP